MRNEVGGYVLGEALYEIDDLVTYRANNIAKNDGVLVRAPRGDFPTLGAVGRLQRELELLNPDGPDWSRVMQPLRRIDDDHNTFLIYDANESLPLDRLPQDSPRSVVEALRISRELLLALGECHDRGVLHCCVNPRTVLWDAVRGRVMLTHFAYARHASRGKGTVESPPVSVFSAPEQSGQLTAGVDQRSDLYAVGAVTYWLLTGEAPLKGDEPSELMHNLVAQSPADVRQLRPEVPAVMAELIARLLGKSPGDRPASASEALELLVTAHEDARAGASAYVSFAPPLGAPKLHGRDDQLAVLHSAVRDASSGAMRVVFMSGAPGSGKTRLADELRYSLPRDRFLLASGKFEQFRQQRPYSALVSAMSALFDIFLSSAEDELGYWKQRFHSVDGNLLAVLVDQIPSMRHIVGDCKAPPRLGPSETQNRFHLAFRALLESLCDREHPFVLTIDDLHWSDDETIALLSESFIATRSAYLLLVLAYRPKEAAASSRVVEFIGRHSRREDVSRRIELEQLAAIDVAALCADIVSPCPQSAELSRRVHRDCHGNPLFALEVIKHYRQTGGLKQLAGPDGNVWHFEPVAAPEAALENVVDFIVSRIDALPESSRRAVVTASCLGHTFDAASLAFALAMSAEELRDALALLVAEDMVVAHSSEASAWLDRSLPAPSNGMIPFGFYHDRIQQAAYSLCDEQGRQRLHLLVGRRLAERGAESQSTLFGAVEHLNQVVALLGKNELQVLAELNLAAGKAAKNMIAYGTATALFEKALNCLEEGQSRLRFDVLLELAESRYLGASFDAAEQAFASALTEARTIEQRVLVHRTQLVLYQHQQRYEEAIGLGIRALGLLGSKLPVQPSPPRLAVSLGLTTWRLRASNVEALRLARDQASDLDRLALDLLVLLWTPCFWTNQKLCGLVVLELVNRTLKLGNTPQAPMAYACYAILNHVLLKRHERALEFSNLAVSVMGPETEPFITSRVRFLTLTFFGALQRDNRANVEAYEHALSSCLSHGEHVFAGHTIDGITTSLPIHGFRLPEIERRLDACRVGAERISSEPSLELIAIIRGWCRSLIDGPQVAAGPTLAELRFDSYVGVHLMLQMVTRYLWDDHQGVIELLGKLSDNVVIQSNPLHAAHYALFGALSLCRQAPGRAAGKIRALVQKVARFERIYSANFRSALLLLEAEVARRGGNVGRALDFYHQGIAEASQRGHDLLHAITCERLASLHEARGELAASDEYLQVAAHSYGRFGATAKVARLASKHPGGVLADTQAGVAASASAAPMVDLRAEAVMRAAYAIAEETRSDRLADTLLSVVTTAAGAQRAFLLKQDGLKWLTLASWSNDRDSNTRAAALGTMPFSEGAVRYVARTKSTVHIHDARDPRFIEDIYFRENSPRSVLCLPLLHRGELLAVLYLENSICADVFTNDQQQLATMLGHQAAIAMAIADYHRVQIDALQAKINPHFLHNALSVIAGLVISQPELAETAILKLSKLYRYVLNSSAGQVVTLDQEIAITRDYLALEACRFGDRLRVELDVSGVTGQVRVPALILQPLVENAVRHGVARKENVGTVHITVAVSATECRLRVADDGPGWHEGKGGSGFGLKSVIDRLKLLYRDDFELSIEKGAGVAVEVRFALKSAPVGVRTRPVMAAGLAES
jgi:predicted ATPase/GAF domain-containing protein